jgi:hypothetical protein
VVTITLEIADRTYKKIVRAAKIKLLAQGEVIDIMHALSIKVAKAEDGETVYIGPTDRGDGAIE